MISLSLPVHRSALAAFIIAALAGLTAPAHAVTYTGTGGAIPDDPDFIGSGVGTFESQIVVTEDFSISDVTVELIGLQHSHSGDLVVSIRHLDTNRRIFLFSEIGDPSGTPGFGHFTDFDGDYAFNDSFTGNIWAAASAGDIPGGDYYPTTLANDRTYLSGFDTESSSGTWLLTITDTYSLDTGSLGSWRLIIDGDDQSGGAAVPEPMTASLGLLGLMGLALVTRRRRIA